MLVDHPPERAGIGRSDRLALVEHRGRSRQQRPVDDVGVADDPADVGGGPEHVARGDVVDVAHCSRAAPPRGRRCRGHRLRLAGGPRRVEDVERVGGRDRHRGSRAPRRPYPSSSQHLAVAAVNQSHRCALLCTMMQYRGGCSDASMARSSIGLYSTARVGSIRRRPTTPSGRRRRCARPVRARRTRRTPPSALRRCARIPASRSPPGDHG